MGDVWSTDQAGQSETLTPLETFSATMIGSRGKPTIRNLTTLIPKPTWACAQ